MAEEESVVERVENLFAGEEDTPSKAPESEPEAPDEEIVEPEGVDAPEEEVPVEEPVEAVVEIEVDGEILEVPEKYKDHFLRQQDYTTKTQEVAAQRREVEVLSEAMTQKMAEFRFAEEVRPDVAKAEQLEATANQYHQYLRENIDSLSSTDIEKIRFSIEDTRRQRDEIVQSVQGKTTEFQQAREQSHRELLDKGTEVLRQKIPGWGKQQQEQVRDYALSLGFTEADISQVVDPRHVEALYKASQYDAIKSGVTPAIKKVQSAPKIKQKARDPNSGKFVKQRDFKNKLKDPKRSDKAKARDILDEMGERFG